MIGIIYCVIAPNNKKYYGQTLQKLQNRKNRHIRDAKNGSNWVFHQSLRKHGYENFIWNTIETYSGDKKEIINKLNERELFWIKFDKTYFREFGYNMTLGGDNYFHIRKPHTEKSKEKIRQSLLGTKFTDERKHNISEAHKGKTFFAKNFGDTSGEKNGMHGISVYDLWIKKYGLEEANKRKELRRIKLSNSLIGKNVNKLSPYNLWLEKYGLEEANKKKEQRRIKLSNSLKGKNKKKNVQVN
jgi:hypothetical protein